MALIKLTPSEIMSQGNEIKGMSGTVQSLLNEIKGLVEQINGGWQGLGNSAFAASYQQLSTTLTKLPEIVEGIGSQAVAGGQTMADLEAALGKQA